MGVDCDDDVLTLSMLAWPTDVSLDMRDTGNDANCDAESSDDVTEAVDGTGADTSCGDGVAALSMGDVLVS